MQLNDDQEKGGKEVTEKEDVKVFVIISDIKYSVFLFLLRFF